MMTFGIKRQVYTFGLGTIGTIGVEVRGLIRRLSKVVMKVRGNSQLWN